MENSNETSLQVVNNHGILRKIANFIKKLFYKDNINYISSINENNSSNNKNSFLKSVKFEEDPDKVMLLKIQDDLEIKDEDRDALKAAFNAAVKLKELDAEIFPGMTIGSLFGN